MEFFTYGITQKRSDFVALWISIFWIRAVFNLIFYFVSFFFGGGGYLLSSLSTIMTQLSMTMVLKLLPNWILIPLLTPYFNFILLFCSILFQIHSNLVFFSFSLYIKSVKNFSDTFYLFHSLLSKDMCLSSEFLKHNYNSLMVSSYTYICRKIFFSKFQTNFMVI